MAPTIVPYEQRKLMRCINEKLCVEFSNIQTIRDSDGDGARCMRKNKANNNNGEKRYIFLFSTISTTHNSQCEHSVKKVLKMELSKMII